MNVTNGRNMLRNFINISRAEIKLLNRHISCAQFLTIRQSKSDQNTPLLRKYFITPNFRSMQRTSSMSLSTSSTSLIDEFDKSKCSEKTIKNETSTNTEPTFNPKSYHHYNDRKGFSLDENTINNTFPICDKSLPVMPRNTIVSATTSMTLQVTTSPRQHYYSTSSIDSDQGRMGNYELHCPACEEM